jgi:hypothetical protein
MDNAADDNAGVKGNKYHSPHSFILHYISGNLKSVFFWRWSDFPQNGHIPVEYFYGAKKNKTFFLFVSPLLFFFILSKAL